MTFLDTDRIETPENVELERRLAGIGSRFIAGLLDNLILFGFYVVVLVVLLISLWGRFASPFDAVEAVGDWVLAMVLIAVFALYWGYFAAFEFYMQGQTPGKKAVKVRVVRHDGGPITFTDVAIRNLLRAVDGIAFYGVAGVVMFISRKGQRLGDLASGTVVVSEQLPDYSSRTDRRRIGGWEAAVDPEDLRATGLEPEEFRLLQNYWSRRHQLSFAARQRLLPKLVRSILQRSGRTLDEESVEGCEQVVAALLGKALAPKPRPGPENEPRRDAADERRTVS